MGRRKRGGNILIRPEKLVSKYRSADRCRLLQKRMTKLKSKYVIPPETKLLVAIRQKGKNIPHRGTTEILDQFWLRKIHHAVFIKVNELNLKMLKQVEPYVMYGPATKQFPCQVTTTFLITWENMI